MKKFIFLVLFVSSFKAFALDCDAKLQPIEVQICQNTYLKDLDETLNFLYAGIDKKPNSKLQLQQKKWLIERNRCEEKKCLEKSYMERINSLFDAFAKNKKNIIPIDNIVGEWETDSGNAQYGKLSMSKISKNLGSYFFRVSKPSPNNSSVYGRFNYRDNVIEPLDEEINGRWYPPGDEIMVVRVEMAKGVLKVIDSNGVATYQRK